jgi:WD40 repeat protein
MTGRKTSRRRGVLLTVTGHQKLLAARKSSELATNFGVRYTNEELSTLTTLSLMTLAKIFVVTQSAPMDRQQPVDRQSIDICFSAFDLVLERSDYFHPDEISESVSIVPRLERQLEDEWTIACDVGEAPDVAVFYGRDGELAGLSQWVTTDRCRLVAILGMGGMGKTTLVTKLAQQLQPDFTTIVWRSLRNAPLLTDLLPKLIEIFSGKTEIISPTLDISSQITCLLAYFRQQRCLLILDNAESIVENPHDSKLYPGYAELFSRIGASSHQSCLLITSREKPAAIIPLEGDRLAVRSLLLTGFTADDSDRLFDAKGLSVSRVGRDRLIALYSGNPLALNIIATSICDLCDRNIDEFLDLDAGLFSDIRQLLDQQFLRLSPDEQVVMYWLAIEREWVAPIDLHDRIVPTMTKQQLLTAFSSLGRRSLIECRQGKFTQQAVVMEYMTARLVDGTARELTAWRDLPQLSAILPLCLSYPLFKSQSPSYIQAIQRRLMLEPVASQLGSRFRQKSALDRYLRSILASMQTHYAHRAHYGGGNLLNLLRYLQIDLTGYDFSNLSLWQADLQGAILRDVNFSGADLAKASFTAVLGWIFAIAISPNSKLVATGEASGEIGLWQVGSGELLHKFKGHSGWVWSLAFSPNGKLLASTSQDATTRLWDVETGRVRHLFQTDSKQVLSVAFHPAGQVLATGHGCGRVGLWHIASGELESTYVAHASEVCSLRFSPDGKLLITGSDDTTAKIWDVATGDLLDKFTEHQRRIWSVRFSPDGKLIATGSGDGTVKVWNLATGKSNGLPSAPAIASVPGYPKWLMSISFSPDSRSLAVGNSDNEVKIWDLRDICTNDDVPKSIATLHGHGALVSLIHFSPDGKLLITGDSTRSLRLWDAQTWHEVSCWKGYNNKVDSVMFLPGGTEIVSGTQDGIVRRWDVRTGDILLQTAIEHEYALSTIDYNPHDRSIASAGEDCNLKIWDAATGKLLRMLTSTHGTAWGARFSPDGNVIASSSMRGHVCLWTTTGTLIATLRGHNGLVRSIAFSPDGRLLATAGLDSSWRLWDLATHTPIHTQLNYGSWIWDLAFSPDGRFLAISGANNIAELWACPEWLALSGAVGVASPLEIVSRGDVATCQLLRSFRGHTQDILTIAFSPDGRSLATGSVDRTIKIWDVETGEVLQTLTGHSDRINAIGYSPDGTLLVSGSGDETIKSWDLATGACLRSFKPPAPYLGMNVTGVTGLTAAAIAALKTLGAIEADRL